MQHTTHLRSLGCIVFVDYKKAFNSVQSQTVLKNRIEDGYIELPKEISTNSSMTVHVHKESNNTNIRRGVRQGDTISPKLFTAAHENIFRLSWETRGMKIDGEYLCHLPFADGILICQQMLHELADENEDQG